MSTTSTQAKKGVFFRLTAGERKILARKAKSANMDRTEVLSYAIAQLAKLSPSELIQMKIDRIKGGASL